MKTIGKRLPCMEDFRHIHYTGLTYYNPVTGQVAWTETYTESGENISEHRMISRVHLRQSADAKSISTPTVGGLRETNPRPASDGSLYFLSDAPGEPQLFHYYSGRYSQLTHLPFGVIDYELSPNEQLIWISAWDGPGSLDFTEPAIFETHPFKSDADLGFKLKRRASLWLYDCQTTDLICLIDQGCSFMHPVWCPDGNSILYQARSSEGTLDFFQVSKRSSRQSSLFLSAVNVSPATANESPMQFTPDGSRIVFAAKKKGADHAEPDRLYMLPFETGNHITVEAIPLLNPDFNLTGVSADSILLYQDEKKCTFKVLPDNSVLYLAADNGSVRVYQAPVTENGGAVPRQITAGEDNFHTLTCLRNGQALCLHTDPLSLPETVLLDLITGTFTEFSVHNVWARDVLWQKARIHWIGDPGTASRTQGYFIPPANLSPDERCPAILYCHGGPTGYYSTALYPEQQALAAAGFAVIYANPRGSTGYGTIHSADEDAYNGNAAADLEDFVREICSLYPFIDSDRLGVCGGSYGGYMTTYLAAHSQMFKAACAHRPLLNWQMIGYASHSAGCMHTRAAFPDFTDYLKECLDVSPTTCAQDIRIPFQIQQSLRDANCIPEQAFQLFTAIRSFNPEVPCRMILYPDSGHSLLSKGPVGPAIQHRKDNLEWFEQWLL